MAKHSSTLPSILILAILASHCSATRDLLTHDSDARIQDMQEALGESEWVGAGMLTNRKLLQQATQDEEFLDAVRRLDYEAVERLLNQGADPDYVEDGMTALHLAIVANDGHLVSLLIQGGADVNGAAGSSLAELLPLSLAAFGDFSSAVAVLLEAGAPVDALSSSGNSALHMAATQGSVRSAELLLDKGATVDIVAAQESGSTPLHAAVQFRQLSMVRLLISRGANVNARTRKGGDVPLHIAAKGDYGLIIKKLLMSGADIDARNNLGITPLYYAAGLGNRSAIEVLVLNGADKGISYGGVTPGEALCECITFKDIPDLCNVEECKFPRRMQQLLAL